VGPLLTADSVLCRPSEQLLRVGRLASAAACLDWTAEQLLTAGLLVLALSAVSRGNRVERVLTAGLLESAVPLASAEAVLLLQLPVSCWNLVRAERKEMEGSLELM